ncbi:hypothetical protein [Leisingera sp.]|nr:hypothetical protein [Leisingera sp.]
MAQNLSSALLGVGKALGVSELACEPFSVEWKAIRKWREGQ